MSKLNLSEIETPLRSKSMSLHPSPQINTLSIKQIGDYILGEEVGSGAFGKVVLGKHILTEEKVAIKILDKMILNQTPEDYELVRKEISILKLVKHKFIVQLYEILQTAQHIFIIMEYCEGKEIMDYILTKNRLSELESLKYFQQLINCLFYLHSQNIAHRDVKIDNMLLDKNKDLKLIDFGLSTKYTDDNLLDQPCGTVVYAAPEVLEGKEYHGMLADVWSSGIVLYGMLSGFLPFADKDDETNKKQVIKGEINYPDFFSDEVKDLLKHMLDIDPMTRYTLQEIKDHPWFNMTDCILIPGIIIDYNIIPVDEKILNLCVTYNKDKNEVYDSIRNNKYDSNSALYYLLIKKLKRKKGFQSVSDLCSDEFIEYILDENNLVNPEEYNNSHQNMNEEKNENYNANENTNRNNNENEEEEEILFENMNSMIREKNEIKEENGIIIGNIKEHLGPEQEIIYENNINYHNEEKEELKEQKEDKENKEEKNIQKEKEKKEDKEIIEEEKEKEKEEKETKGIIMEEIITEEKEEKEILEDKEKENEEKDLKKEENNNEINLGIENEKNNEINEKKNIEIAQKSKIVEIDEEILNKNVEKNDDKPNKLIDLINSSFSQTPNFEDSNKNIKDINNNNLQGENIPTKENLNKINDKVDDNNQIENNIIKTDLIKEPISNQSNNNNNENINKNNENSHQEIIEDKVEENLPIENICFTTSIIEKSDDNKILELKRKIIEEGEKEISEKLKEQNKANEKEKNDNLNEKKPLEEKIVKEENINKENKDSNIQKIAKDIKPENKNKPKKDIKIESIDICIYDENKKENNTKQIQDEKLNIQDKDELKIGNENENKKEIIKEDNNNLQNLIKTQIDLTVNDGNDINEERKELQKIEKTINNIEVVDIKINKEKNINLKNDKKYQKTNEKNKSKILQSKKSNNKIKYIFKSQKKKLFSIEKTNNVLNNLKKSQSKLKYINKPKISIGTEIKNNKNRSVFKMQYSQNTNYKRDSSVGQDTFKKDFSNIENYSTRNPQKKLIFTNSKPNIDFNKKSTNKKNHTNLKKKTSNKILKIINILNNNHFNSNGKDLKLKNFIHSSSQNYQNIKLNKTNLHSKFEEIAKDRNKEKKDDLKKSIQYKAYNNLSLNRNESNSIYNFSKNKSMSNKNQNVINRNSNIKKNVKSYINYNSLINKNKKKNTNKLNISNILKSIICLEYTDKNDKNSNSKNKRSSKNIIKNYNKSISHNYNKNNDLKNKEIIGAITEENHTDKKPRQLESSVIVNRYKSPIGIRQLSESPKQKYLNIKTRYARIPWKIKKKGIDEKLDSHAVYSKYLNKIENPFNQNNSKIVNYNKMNKILRNSLNSNQKFNRSVWTANIKQIKIGNYNNFYNNNKKSKNSKNRFCFKEKTSRNNNQLSKEKLSTLNKIQKEKVNVKNNNIVNTPNKIQKSNFNIASKTNIKATNINSLALMKQYFKKNEIIINANKKNLLNQNLKGSVNINNNIHHQHSNSLTSSLTINLQNKFTIIDCNNSIIYKPIDLSCLFFNHKDINEVCINLKNKLRKYSINYVQRKNNIFVCNKNGYNCEFEIIDMNEQKNGENEASNAYFENIFYLKTYGKKEGYRINDIFKKFILNLD